MTKKPETTEYFLGLDVGAEAVGYAVAGEDYALRKFRGEPMWGVHLFDGAESAEERRLFRSARRVAERRKQRVRLVQEIFAKEIAAVDPGFYLRIRESALFPEDSEGGVHLFGSREADGEYNKKYPTIHHLICELLEGGTPSQSRCARQLSQRESQAGAADESLPLPLGEVPRRGGEGHDVRLVYLACAWLVAHRGHFLMEDGEFEEYFRSEGVAKPRELLDSILRGEKYISRAKVADYERHKEDLRRLKGVIRKYAPERYNEVFRLADRKTPNYTAYSGNYTFCPGGEKKRASREAFGKYIKGILRDITPEAGDGPVIRDILDRIGDGTFLPKQTGYDNRVVPHPVYALELRDILNNAAGYLPFLREADGDGYTPEEKLLAVMDHRVPYYVGPTQGGWLVRKGEGPIRPWNFEDTVDGDASEEAFIRRMTGQCTYLPGEDVLPKQSAVYQRFLVLNELNTMKADGVLIPVEAKQRIFSELLEKGKKPTANRLRELVPGYEGEGMTAALTTHGAFRRLMEAGTLGEADVERIVARGTYSQDRRRFRKWLEREYPGLSGEDAEYIAGMKLRDFGRLSGRFLTELMGAERKTGEADTVLGWMWKRNVTLSELMTDRYTFAEQIAAETKAYYAGDTRTLAERLEDMYVPAAAKRPIYRALDVVSDVVKAMGHAPKRLFLETAPPHAPEGDFGKESRYEKLCALYKGLDTPDADALRAELQALAGAEERRLQSDRLYLYFLQMGRCMYTGERIAPGELNAGRYNLEHIYPRRKVRDESVSSNLVLVRSDANRWKDDGYPVPEDIRARMADFWQMLRSRGFITGEKYSRLTRGEALTPEEEWRFVSRPMDGQQRIPRVLKTLMGEMYPETEVVCVSGALVAEFRREFHMIRCRTVNDLYHAKDAYLAIAVGNVWHERFTRHWFFAKNREAYTVNVSALFANPVVAEHRLVWAGREALEQVRRTVRNKNAMHLTRHAYCRTGALFEQQPAPAKEGLVERKAGLPTEKYGGYTGVTVSFFLLAQYRKARKLRLSLVAVKGIAADWVRQSEENARAYAENALGGDARDIAFPLGLRPVKINTVFELDGFRVALRGASAYRVSMAPLSPLVIGYEWEAYVWRLARFAKRRRANPKLVYNEQLDGISAGQNLALYDLLCDKLESPYFKRRPANPWELLRVGRRRFEKLDIYEQVSCLYRVLELFGKGIAGTDLTAVGGKRYSAVPILNMTLNNWKGISDIRIVDASASGLWESRSPNLRTMFSDDL